MEALTQFTIRSEVLARVDQHAREAYPEESCGFLTGPASDPTVAVECLPAENRANFYHARLPEQFPRTAATFYVIDPKKIMETFDTAERKAQPVRVIYHSHCDVGAYFSAEDQAAAAPEGHLMYPVLFLVTSVRAGRVVDDHKLFQFVSGKWCEVSLRIA